MKTLINPRISLILKSLREEGGYTQLEFARILGISRSFLSEIENGRRNPTLNHLNTISEKLGIPLPIIFLRAFNVDEHNLRDQEEVIKDLQKSVDKLRDYFKVPLDLEVSGM